MAEMEWTHGGQTLATDLNCHSREGPVLLFSGVSSPQKRSLLKKPMAIAEGSKEPSHFHPGDPSLCVPLARPDRALCPGQAEQCWLWGTVQLRLCVLRLPETASMNVANYCIMRNTSLWESHL